MEYRSKFTRAMELLPIHLAYANHAPKNVVVTLTKLTKQYLFDSLCSMEGKESEEEKVDISSSLVAFSRIKGRKVQNVLYSQLFMDAIRLCLWDEAKSLLDRLPADDAKGDSYFQDYSASFLYFCNHLDRFILYLCLLVLCFHELIELIDYYFCLSQVDINLIRLYYFLLCTD